MWEWVVKRRIFDPFSDFSGWVQSLPDSALSAYTALQGGLVLWCPLSPLAPLRFVVTIPSPYLAGVIACQEE